MELIIKRLKELGFDIKVVTRMADQDVYFITHTEAHKNNGAYVSNGFTHVGVTPPEEKLREHLEKVERKIELTIKSKDNVLFCETRSYKKFNEIPLNWVPAGDILRPEA